jgi:hypothetical protein
MNIFAIDPMVENHVAEVIEYAKGTVGQSVRRCL